MKAGFMPNGYLLFVTDGPTETSPELALQWRDFSGPKVAGAFSNGANALNNLRQKGTELTPFSDNAAMEFLKARMPAIAECTGVPPVPAFDADGNTLIHWFMKTIDETHPDRLVGKEYFPFDRNVSYVTPQVDSKLATNTSSSGHSTQSFDETVVFPDFRAPSGSQETAGARLYVLKNILGEFNNSVKRYDTPNPEKSARDYEVMLTEQPGADLRDRISQHLAVSYFRAAINNFEKFFQGVLENKFEYKNLKKAYEYLGQYDATAKSVWLITDYRHSNQLLDSLRTELVAVVSEDFDQLLQLWKERISDVAKVIFDFRRFLRPYFVEHLGELTDDLDQLAKNVVEVAMAKRGSTEYNRHNLLAYNHRYRITERISDLEQERPAPLNVEILGLLKLAIKHIDWMGRWGRADVEQCEAIKRRISELSIGASTGL